MHTPDAKTSCLHIRSVRHQVRRSEEKLTGCTKKMDAKITDTATLYLDIITIRKFTRLTSLTMQKHMIWPQFTVMKIIPSQRENGAAPSMYCGAFSTSRKEKLSDVSRLTTVVAASRITSPQTSPQSKQIFRETHSRMGFKVLTVTSLESQSTRLCKRSSQTQGTKANGSGKCACAPVGSNS